MTWDLVQNIVIVLLIIWILMLKADIERAFASVVRSLNRLNKRK